MGMETSKQNNTPLAAHFYPFPSIFEPPMALNIYYNTEIANKVDKYTTRSVIALILHLYLFQDMLNSY